MSRVNTPRKVREQRRNIPPGLLSPQPPATASSGDSVVVRRQRATGRLYMAASYEKGVRTTSAASPFITPHHHRPARAPPPDGKAGQPPEVTLVLPDGPVLLTQHAAEALLAFTHDEYQHRHTVHHKS